MLVVLLKLFVDANEELNQRNKRVFAIFQKYNLQPTMGIQSILSLLIVAIPLKSRAERELKLWRRPISFQIQSQDVQN
jgi:ABC-type lipoprotein export system ATPase subunit